MPRVLSVFKVTGTLGGAFPESPLDATLTVLDGGVLLGRVTPDSSRTHEISLVDGKANLDLFESTETHLVYSCRFSLIKYDTRDATIVDCAARISETNGLVGRWNMHDLLGKAGVCDHAFEMKSVRVVDSDIVKPGRTSKTQVVAVESSFATAELEGSRDLFLRGDAVDQNGYICTTTLQATLHANGSVTGTSTETGKRCKLAGSWSGDSVSYTLEYPINGRMTRYGYRGLLEKKEDGSETLSGTWKYEKQTVDEAELFGGFEFCSVKNVEAEIQSMLPGVYCFSGTATSDCGTKYDSKLSLTLASDKSLTGKAHEVSIAPQVCDLKGSWDESERAITYRMIYTNGNTGSYEYVGQLHGQQFIGRWVNPRAAELESERGDFVFTLTSFQASNDQIVDAKPSVVGGNLEQPTTTDSSLVLTPGDYILTGSATSNNGMNYESKLILTLAADGLVTGKSEELSVAPQTCELKGTWDKNDQKITYLLEYTNASTEVYEYVGRFHSNQLTGRWLNIRSSESDSEKGEFEFRVVSLVPLAVGAPQTVKKSETTCGDAEAAGTATSDSATKYDSKLFLTLLADGSLVGTSEELTIAHQVCELKGSWSGVDKQITYRMEYTNGCTATYEYAGRFVGRELRGRWVNLAKIDSAAERGGFIFHLVS